MGVLATNLSKLVLGVDIPSSSGKKSFKKVLSEA